MKKQQNKPQTGKQKKAKASSNPNPQVGNRPAMLANSKLGKNTEPMIQRSKAGVRIRHREFLSTISGAVAFSVASSVVIQPGLSASFPWLATQAVGWEQYRFHKLCYEYISRSAATRDGTILLAPDYDVLDAAPATELVAASYRDSMEDSSWQNVNCYLDVDAMFGVGPRKYVRASAVAGADMKTYDCGTMHVCVVGQADSSAIGKLWVDYDVEFFVPQTNQSGVASNPSQFAQFNLSANQSLTTATAATLGFDETVTNNLSITNSTGVFTLPLGNWEIYVEASGSGGTAALQTLRLDLEKNSAALSPVPCFSVCTNGSTGTGEVIRCSLNGFISSSGSDTARVRITFTSTTGTLVAALDQCRISFRIC